MTIALLLLPNLFHKKYLRKTLNVFFCVGHIILINFVLGAGRTQLVILDS